jgi:hypothetical protein
MVFYYHYLCVLRKKGETYAIYDFLFLLQMGDVKLTTCDYYDLVREKAFLEILKEYMDNDYPKFLSDLQTYYPGKTCVQITPSGVIIKVTWQLEVELLKYDEEDACSIPRIIVRKLHNKTWTPIRVTYFDIMRAAEVRILNFIVR